MKKIWIFICLLVLSLSLAATPAFAAVNAEETAQTAVTYRGLQARVKNSAGIRSLWEVDRAKIAALEDAGYTVSVGAVMAVAEHDGAVVTYGGAPVTAESITVEKTEDGFTTPLSAAKAICVYETGMPSYATGKYLYMNESAIGFAFTTVWGSEDDFTQTVMETTGLVYSAFLSIEKEGTVKTYYTRAVGETFGAESAQYGVSTSLYEISDYFLNAYRADGADTVSLFKEAASLRKVVSACGIVVDYDDMKKNGTATEVSADSAAGTDATYVVNGAGTGNGITFTVPNAKAGMYSVLVRMTNNNKVTSEVGLNANGRLYRGRILEGDTLASDNLAVASDDGYRDIMFHVMLDEGDNGFNLYMESGTYNNAFGVAGVKFVLEEEISPKDVVLGGENLISTGHTNYEKGTGLFKDIYNVAFRQKGEFTYKVNIPVGGTYRMVALATFALSNTVTTTFADKDGVTVAEASFTATAAMKHGGSRTMQVIDAFGAFTLPAGELTLTVTSAGQAALSNIALLYEEPVDTTKNTEAAAKENAKTDILSYLPGIACWGDSLTANTNYPSVLKNYLNELTAGVSTIPVVNLGVAGETSITIAGRSGAMPWVLSEELVIPATTDRVRIYFTAPDGQAVDPLRWMEYDNGIGVNDVEIGGVKGKLYIEKTSSNSYNNPYYFVRNTAGSAVTVPVGTEILTSGREYAEKGYYPIIFMGQNGGWNNDPAYLVEQINAMLGDAEKYLIIGLHTGSASGRAALETAMQAEYGSRYINLRSVFANENIADRVNTLCGVSCTLTADDLQKISEGRTPSFVLADSVHFNEYGYTVVASEVYARMRSLGDLAPIEDAMMNYKNFESTVNTTFDFVAKDQTLTATETLENGTVFMTRSSSLKMTVKIEHAGVYRLSGKYNTNGGKIHYVTLKSDIDTAHGMESRLNSASSKSTYTSTSEFTVTDTSTAFTDADALGFIYLSEGTHNLTFKIEGNSGMNGFGIYNLRLSMETAQPEGSIRISGKAYDTATAVNVTANPSSYGSKAVLLEYKDSTAAHAEYRFTPTVTGTYSLYALISDRNDKTEVFTVTDAKGKTVHTASFTTPISKWSKDAGYQHYGFGNAGAATLETHLSDGIYLKAGETYTLSVDATTSLSRLHIADLRLVLTEREVTYYEEVDAGFTAGALSAETGDTVKKADSFVSVPLLVKKAGTTLRLVTSASAAGALPEGYLAVVSYKPTAIGYVPDTASALTVVGGGYTASSATEIGGGYVSYYVTTTTDNTVLRFSAMAKELAQLKLYCISNDETEITPFDLGDVELANKVTVDSVEFGTEASVNGSVSGASEGTLLLLGYDKADTLVSLKAVVKNDYAVSFAVDFDDTAAEVASVRLVLVDGLVSASVLSDMTVLLKDKTLTVPAKDVVIDPATLVPEETNANAFVVRADEMNGSSGVTTLSDGTLLLPNTANEYATFTVNAPVAGMYRVDMKYNRANNYIQYFYVYNTSYSAWGSDVRGEGRYGAESNVGTATDDEGFAVGNAVRYSAYDASPEAYVWLNAGPNTLKIAMKSKATAAKLGVDAIRFTPDYTATEDTVLVPYGAMKTAPSGYTNIISSGSQASNNGFFLRDGSKVYFTVTVPEDAAYKVTSLASSDGPSVTLMSDEMSFFPVKANFGTNKIGDSSTSILPLDNGVVHLKAGTHTVALVVENGWYHFNMLAFDKVGAYDSDKTIAVQENTVDIDREGGAFTAGYTVSVMKGSYPNALTAYLEVSGVDAGGAFSYTVEKTVPVGAVTELSFAGEARTGLEEINLVFTLYDKNGVDDALVYSGKPTRYTANSTLNVLVLTDTHYTGINENQMIYDYANNKWIADGNATKNYNNYTAEYDIYGWTSDEKLQRVVDDLLLRYEKGEFDIIMHLGDSAMNDGNYNKFQQNHTKYKESLSKKWAVYSDPEGEELEGFWEHPLNITYVVKKKFFDKLSAAGIPYYVANGNHEYFYSYNDDKTDIEYTAWENLYHYAELFGHRTETPNGKYLRDENGNYIYYTDSDSVHYTVRVIRRNGEIKILSALSESELEAFKAKYAGDGNCYDFYVSEDTLSDSDELLAAFVMSNPHQFPSFEYYNDVFVVDGNYKGQTVRPTAVREDMMRAMCQSVSDFPVAYMVAHMVSAGDLNQYIAECDNFRGVFYGDVHDEEHYYSKAGTQSVPYWVVGHFSSAYDIDDYYNADGTKDNQYYYDRSTTNKVGNQVWGDFTRHPWNYMMLEVHGDVSYAERVHSAVLYENGGQVRLTYDEVTGMDIRYVRAIADASLYEAYEMLYAAHIDGTTRLYRESELAAAGLSADDSRVRKVFVGGDVATVGSDYMYLKADYVENTYVNPDYIIDKSGNVYTTAMAKVGTATNEDGSAFSHPSKFTALTDEGKKVVFDGKTYTLSGVIGGVSGHYLYDMDSNYVYVDNDGNLVFYNPIEVDGDYIEASIQAEFVLNDGSKHTLYDPPYQRTWFYRAEDGSFVSLDKNGDGKLDAGEYTGFYRTNSIDKHNANADIDPKIVIDENGRFVTGEGWAHFQYLATYTYADGTVVAHGENGDIAIDYAADGSIVYGMYIPYATYAGEWF